MSVLELKAVVPYVIRCLDGDTIEVMEGRRKYIVRIHSIDAPEKDQRFGRESQEYLTKLLQGKPVTLVGKKGDKYGRKIRSVFSLDKKVDIAHEMIRAGLAWHYKQYDRSTVLADAETNARMRQVGIWSEPNPMPPWVWRHRDKPPKVQKMIHLIGLGRKYFPKRSRLWKKYGLV